MSNVINSIFMERHLRVPPAGKGLSVTKNTSLCIINNEHNLKKKKYFGLEMQICILPIKIGLIIL